jgi:hypothetical protein
MDAKRFLINNTTFICRQKISRFATKRRSFLTKCLYITLLRHLHKLHMHLHCMCYKAAQGNTVNLEIGAVLRRLEDAALFEVCLHSTSVIIFRLSQ